MGADSTAVGQGLNVGGYLPGVRGVPYRARRRVAVAVAGLPPAGRGFNAGLLGCAMVRYSTEFFTVKPLGQLAQPATQPNNVLSM